MWRFLFVFVAGCALDAGPNEPYPVFRLEVIGDPAGCLVLVQPHSCERGCELRLPPETEITTETVPPSCYNFAGWSGGSCSGTMPCTFRLVDDVAIQASFR
jgi:hypothetical protein